ncbi:MAG: Holliday junction branch migration protein RuvA [Acidobacteria bacterium]|nr:Holliday junction branch migration protein RuvA [Acidobacteriota bacterium]MBV9477016.1 Holliday junction branch migration protein RuvA [Acidobacteriota bacterium]
MIGYLEGTLRQLDATRALVLTGGVGYEVHISLSTYYRLEGQREVALEIHTHVREDALALYGFATREEKIAFEKLISISGIGPTVAQKILSGIDAHDLADAVARSDTRKLSSIPGIGKKTAERICLELRDKLAPVPESAPVAPTRTSIDDDVHSALLNLGYRAKDAEAALEKARKEIGNDAEFSAVLRAALRQLTR